MQAYEAYTDVLKVIILGDSGVGKTSLMNQYVRSLEPHHSNMCRLPFSDMELTHT
jgi:GTPase SAR1 family protein